MSIQRDYAEFLASFASTKFQALWPGQAHVLNTYATAFTSESDIAVELPTGAGKTLIALLIAEAWRQEGKKVAILSANKTLARQMYQEAQALGIPAALMEGRGPDISAIERRAYGRATKIAIMNYWVYFNQNPVIDIADLLIMDDAHLAEHCLHSLYSVEIEHYAHESLFKDLVTELHARFPENALLADALAHDVHHPPPPELLSFIDQTAITGRLRAIVDASPYLRDAHGGSTDLGYRWGRLRNKLDEANIYISARSIWIRPYIYPLLSDLQYEQTQQRIYMSATVGDPGDLSRRLGVRDIKKIPIPAEYAEKTSGRRLIIMNRLEEEEDIPDRLGEAILAALRIHPKSVWLCSSKTEADKWQSVVSDWLNSNGLVGHPTWLLTPLGDEIDQFKSAPQGHLFIAGRFDGMDFQAEECRLVILTTLPRAINTQEEFISAYLRDSGFMIRRLNQRIVQALGRCNRSADDYGIYVFADRRFASHFGLEAHKVDLPQNIIAEIDMAQDTAEMPAEELKEQIERFLLKDFEQYDRDIHAHQAEIPTRSVGTVVPDTSSGEVLGWAALFASQNYEVAASRFEACWNAARTANLIEIGAFHGWNWAKALYLQGVQFQDPAAHERALATLEEVIRRGGQSAWFNRMHASLNRERNLLAQLAQISETDYAEVLIRSFDDLLENLGVRGNAFEKWCTAISERLESESHTQYQQGLERLGRVLGYHAALPRHGSATDCLWRGVFGNHREIITFEAKIEQVASGMIVAYNVGQALIQLHRAFGEYQGQGYTIRGTIVTHLRVIAPDAEAGAGSITVLEKAAVLALWSQIKTLLRQYRSDWSLDNIAVRRAAAQALRPKIPRTGWLIRALDSGGRFLGEERLCAEWGSDSLGTVSVP